jgi:predicted DsbA family dithiol-disulfide isomerase
MLQRLEQTARSLGLPFGERRMSFNSRRAQEAAKWAETHGKADAFHNAVFRAYFAAGKNLHEIETLAAAVEAVGLKGADLEEVLRKKTFKSAVDQDWLRSHQLSITAVPTFRINGENLIGAQPYEQMAAFLSAHGVPTRKP